jgi:hypothetical protein
MAWMLIDERALGYAFPPSVLLSVWGGTFVSGGPETISKKVCIQASKTDNDCCTRAYADYWPRTLGILNVGLLNIIDKGISSFRQISRVVGNELNNWRLFEIETSKFQPQ